MPEAREKAVGEEHQETAEPGEQTEREVYFLNISELCTELRALFVESGITEHAVRESLTR